MLTIFRERLEGIKITVFEENDLIYHHLWVGLFAKPTGLIRHGSAIKTCFISADRFRYI